LKKIYFSIKITNAFVSGGKHRGGVRMIRKGLVLVILCAGLLIGLTLTGCGGGFYSKPQTEKETPQEPAEPAEPVKKVEEKKIQPQVEVVFVLDTTGSMSGLIEGAKRKIWYIANQIVLGEPRPNVKLSLVPYRDKGDVYVTKVFDLTDNIDQVYTDLMEFSADGGGDTPEHVNQALYDAVNKISWSKDPDTLKIIYLVGDSPPHNEYQDVPTYEKLAESSIQNGIYINTILCGNNMATEKVWKEIADKAEGTYLAIEQGGGVKHIDTPFDKELADLNTGLVDTAIVYGNKEIQVKQGALNITAKNITEEVVVAGKAVAADRAAYSAITGSAAKNDLVEEVIKKNVSLDKVDKKMLPEKLQKMSKEELKKYVAEKQAERRKIMKKIEELAAKRAAYIKEQLSRYEGEEKGFDLEVVESLKKLAKKKNIKYE
jgi:Mg-chelatase subunit ChlD